MIVHLHNSNYIDSIYKKVGMEYNREVLDYEEIKYIIEVDKLDNSLSESTNKLVRQCYQKKLY